MPDIDCPPVKPDSAIAEPALRGCRATVMGLGRHGGGVAATRFLASQGAHVMVTDVAAADRLADSLAVIGGVELAGIHLGGHAEEDFREAELLVVNPAVRPDNPFVQLARKHGARITSEIELLLERTPCGVIGATGSNGKSTTCAMIASILSASGRRVWLGGNIERSLLADLPQMTASDWVVLELSSFQLYWLSAEARLPEIAVIANCTPNHLDWHPDFAHYGAAKRRLLEGSGVAVLGIADWKQECPRTVIDLFDDARIPQLRVPGSHNRRNAACAAAAALAAGCDDEAIVAGLASFAGLPHRLETIAHHGGRRFINDTQATTPEATMAALDAVEGRCWLLCGGADKGASFDGLAQQIARRCAGVACYGAVGPQIEKAVRSQQSDLPVVGVQRLAEAVAWCFARSDQGDVILLSPACASTDQYRDYADRAADFRAAAQRYA